MNSDLFFDKLDKLYKEKDLEKIDTFLTSELEEATKNGDDFLLLSIMNEMIGHYRDIGNYEKSLEISTKALNLMEKLNMIGGVEYATSLQNIANAYRAAGKNVEALGYFNIVFKIYKDQLDSDDYKFASLHNNIALLYQQMGNFVMAEEHLKKAYEIIVKIPGSEIQVATTLSNLAATEIELDEFDKARNHLEEALKIFRKDEIKDFHYSAALCALAALRLQEEKREEAIGLYDEALLEIEKNMGKESDAYKTTLENRAAITSLDNTKKTRKEKREEKKAEKKEEKLAKKTKEDEKELEPKRLTGMEICKKFYEEIGAPMIHEKFPDIENQMAVGLVGEGSEVFGFDDEFSMDHDFGPGFCIWLEKELYKARGDEVQAEYDKLPDEYLGIKRSTTKMGKGRVGVWRIGDFFEEYTNYRTAPMKAAEWIDIDDYKLATVTNGEIFRDDVGAFTDRRRGFLAQPPEAYRVKLARMIASMAQMESNYERAMARKDYVTAQICISKYMEDTLHCIYLLNDQYAPYYKWLLRGSKSLEILPEVGDILRALADTTDQREAWENYKYDSRVINENDKKVMIMEMVSKLVLNELLEQGIIKVKRTNFLGDYVHEVLMAPQAARLIKEKTKKSKEELIDEIIALEIEAFDKVENIGGRADCQDDTKTFTIMRKSQYLVWTEDMLKTLLELWKENKNKGWNMITEKYARMMESTSPDEYKGLEASLPERSERTLQVVKEIVVIQSEWMKEFAEKYPNVAKTARDISSDADDLYNTSFATYLKGELLTYSDELIKKYAEFVISLVNENKNMSEMIIENTVKMNGFESLEEAEKAAKDKK